MSTSKRYELAREGELTSDGRWIEVGALQLPADGVVPLLDRTDPEDGSRIIGMVSNLHREGSRIYGEIAMDLEAITIDVDQSTFEHNEEKDRLELKSGRLIAGWKARKDAYPWKDEQ